jgi:multidrug efflux pump subunit AcrB
MSSENRSKIKYVKSQVGDFYKFTTTRPVAILMVVIGILVFGWISYEQLPLNLMPDITYPSLTVRTEYSGTAPEEIETTITRPVEQGLGVVNNLVSISSISKADQSDVKLEFTWDTDMDQATADVREKLDQVFLPEEAKRPLILRYDPTLEPILRLGLYGDRSLFYLRYLAEEELKRIFETIEGVAAVKVKGGLEEEIRVELNEQQLTLIGINIQQIKNRLAQENINLAGGNLKEGQTEYLVRTLNEFKSVQEISEVVVGNWNGREIKIRDIGMVHRTNKDREIITRINGKESVEIEIYKEADANVVAVANLVKDRIFGTTEQQAFVRELEEQKKRKAEKKEDKAKEKPKTAQRGGPGEGGDEFRARMMTNFIAYQMPEGTKIDLLADRSVFIENSVSEVKNTAIMGGILAVMVLFLFLRNLTITLIIGISIPISIISTFAPMKIFDVSLNIMSLGGLALGIGMLVDNSIVVLESIARCREEGDGLIDATVRGVSEVGSAVFASTLTTVAVFFPIVFVEGVAGQIFGDMALTVVFSLLASLAVALFLIPMLSSRQTSQFTAGINLGGAEKTHIFYYKTQETIDTLIADQTDEGYLQKFVSGIKAILKTNLLIIWKILKTTGALIVFTVKFFCLPIILILTPIFGLLRISKIIKFKVTEKTTGFAQNPDFWKVKYVKEIWETFLIIKSFPDFIAKMRDYKTSFKNSNWKGKVAKIILFPFTFIFILFKYLFQAMLEISFRFWHFFLVSFAVLIKGLFLQLKLIFSPPSKAIFAAFTWSYNKVETLYPKVLNYSLNNRGVIIISMMLSFLFIIYIIAPRLGSELIPEVHQGEFNIELTFPVGTPVETTDSRSLVIQESISQKRGVGMVAAVSGTDKTANQSSEEGEHTAKLTVTMERASSVVQEEEKLIDQIRTQMVNFSGVQWKISRPVLFSFKTPIELELQGYNLPTLQKLSQSVEEQMQDIPGLYDVKSSVQRGNPEVQIIYNRSLLARYGLNVSDIATIVRNKIRGDVATEFKEQDRKIDILVRLRESDKESIEDLRRLIINPGSAKPIPLEAIADIRINEGPAEIRRVEQQRTGLITANISGRDLKSVSEDIYNRLRNMDIPQDFTYQLTGQNKEMETSLNSLKLALALAIFLVYIVMASQFESLIHPFIIIFTIPLALIGVFLFLFLLNIPISIVVFLGMIMLAGIVVNNAIVLVDYINHLRDRGLAKMEAIVEAGKIRLRPIIMTTTTTVLGLLPMALGLGDGAEIRTPMAITVIVGLISSTVLTLVVIPTVYSLVDRKD